MPIAQMDEGEIEGPETPVGHDLDEAPLADELGLDDRRKLADAPAREQRRGSPAKSFIARHG